MGSLWGTYDEAANAASFQDAVASWRQGGLESADRETPAPAPALVTATAPRRVARLACFECMRRFQSEPLTCPVTKRTFCSTSCYSKYQSTQARRRQAGGHGGITALEQLRARLAKGASAKAEQAMKHSRPVARSGSDQGSVEDKHNNSGKPQGGSLWGTYDEEASAAAFKAAVADFRTGGDTHNASTEGHPPKVQARPHHNLACYGCFKLVRPEDGVHVDGKTYCSHACAPATDSRGVGDGISGWVPQKGARAQYIGSSLAKYAGVIGIVTRDPDRQVETKLRLADGSTTPWLLAIDLGPVAEETRDKSHQISSSAPRSSKADNVCARTGCERSFVKWRGVAMLTPAGPQLFCSEKCAPKSL